MIREAVYHRSKFNWAYGFDRDTIHLRLRTKRDDVLKAEAIVVDKYAFQETLEFIPMRKFASDALFDYWETAYRPPYRRLRYAFKLHSQDEQWYYTEQGFHRELSLDYFDSFEYPYLHPNDMFQAPAWVKEAVFYQIFPERFANGDPDNDPEGTEPWGGKPEQGNFFGGDLQGVIDHLDYVAELGVNALYFTPVFEATTNHKYDTEDYLKVDQHFGSNEKLKELVAACHKRGIRVLLDAVFNHAGRTFPPFVDVQKRGSESPYADWFYVKEYPLTIVDGKPNYETFAFEPLMPKLNTSHPDVKKYLLKVAKYWVEEIGIDGWRLDVANEVDHQFWREFRQVVKQVNPDAYILGEIWHDSLIWLQGDQFDAVMNYPFTDAVLNFFARQRTDARDFADALGSLLASYPQPVTEVSFNLLDSHDTPRLLTVCGGDVRRMKLAALFQFTYPGTPCIYYGDEIGLDGGQDPDCRKCMIWDETKQDRTLFAFYQRIIALRRKHEALRSANIRFLRAEQGERVVAYELTGRDSRFVIAINANDLPAELLLEEEEIKGSWTLEYGEGITYSDAAEQLTLKLGSYGFGIFYVK